MGEAPWRGLALACLAVLVVAGVVGALAASGSLGLPASGEGPAVTPAGGAKSGEGVQQSDAQPGEHAQDLRACNGAAGSCTLAEYARQPFGDLLIMRHALAPGGGDPDSFELRACDTQRNLDAAGRAQSTEIGNALAASFTANGVVMSHRIYSSQWCRCLETARLVAEALADAAVEYDGGESPSVVEEWGLNSFYQPSLGFSRDQCMARLEEALLETARESQQLRKGKFVQTLLVTHYVTVSAVTGKTVSSGGVIAYNSRTKESLEILVS